MGLVSSENNDNNNSIVNNNNIPGVKKKQLTNTINKKSNWSIRTVSLDQ